jgi:hypothetical protein
VRTVTTSGSPVWTVARWGWWLLLSKDFFLLWSYLILIVFIL